MPRAGKESDLRRVLYGMVIMMMIMMMVDRDSMSEEEDVRSVVLWSGWRVVMVRRVVVWEWDGGTEECESDG